MAFGSKDGIIAMFGDPGVRDAALDAIACVAAHCGGGIAGKSCDLAPDTVVGEFVPASTLGDPAQFGPAAFEDFFVARPGFLRGAS